MKRFATVVALILTQVQLLPARNLYSVVRDSSTDCVVYQKVNGTTMRWRHNECSVGNDCCFSAIVFDRSGEVGVEVGGCESDYEAFLLHHPAVDVHPLDRIPLFGRYNKHKITEYCQLNMCHASSSPKNHWRVCACSESNCNEKGIEALLAKHANSERVLATTYSLDLIERDIQIVVDG